jgi:hypothetical protein
MQIKKATQELKGIFKLDHCIKLYIPSTKEADKVTDNAQVVADTLELFSKLFGGATSFEARGAWVSDSKGLIVERITIVESYGTAEQVDANIEEVLLYARTIKHTMLQEAVSLEYDNELYLI